MIGGTGFKAKVVSNGTGTDVNKRAGEQNPALGRTGVGSRRVHQSEGGIYRLFRSHHDGGCPNQIGQPRRGSDLLPPLPPPREPPGSTEGVSEPQSGRSLRTEDVDTFELIGGRTQGPVCVGPRPSQTPQRIAAQPVTLSPTV